MSTSNLEEFKKQMAGQKVDLSTPMPTAAKPTAPQVQPGLVPPPQTQQVIKNIVISVPSDYAGCGHIRNLMPMSYLGSIYGRGQRMLVMTTPYLCYQEDILARTKAIFFQRQMSPQHVNIIRNYKQHQARLKYKMIWELDDYIWGKNEDQGGSKKDGVPTYNFGSAGITDDVKNSAVEVMKMMDLITVSTQPLADYITNELGIEVPVAVVPNSVPAYLWGGDRRGPVTEDIKKPKVIYTGSPTHYRNPSEQDPRKMLGDFENAWKDWAIKSVKNGEIEFTCLGGLPWFFEEIKDKINIVDFIDSYRYPNLVKSQRADFGIMPLVSNMFNNCKSDIKYIEHCAAGIAAIGSTFTDGTVSPYDEVLLTLPDNCTVEDIDKMVREYCKKENFNEIIEKQYKYLDENGRYTESPQYVNAFMDTLYK